MESKKNTNSVAELPPPENSEAILSSMKLFYDLLKTKRKTAEMGLVMDYGTYEIKGSSGRDFEIQSMWQPLDPKNPEELEQSFLHLFTVDKSTRKLVAIRDVYFEKYENDFDSKDKNKKKITASGEIHTKYRGIGAASVTDKVLVEVLGKITSNYPNLSYTAWEITNGNMIKAEDVKKDIKILEVMEEGERKNSALKYLNDKLEEYKKEQERWQSLYGPKGKLGFDGDGITGIKNISPNKDSKDFKPTKVNLDKYDTLTEKVRQASIK